MHHFALLTTTHASGSPLTLPTPCPGGEEKDGSPYDPPRLPFVLCPTCARPIPYDEMSIDHAPQQGGQSSLGPAVSVVLSCKDCNGDAGRSYEQRASTTRQRVESSAGVPDLEYARGGDPVVSAFLAGGSEHDLMLNDLKAAFLVAFATLGYQWALARQLEPIRRALLVEQLPDRKHARRLDIRYERPGNLVIEVHRPHPCIVVRPNNGPAVVLPMPGHPQIPEPDQFGDSRTRTHEWPDLLGPHKSGAGHYKMIVEAHAQGRLFHADYCHTHGWT